MCGRGGWVYMIVCKHLWCTVCILSRYCVHADTVSLSNHPPPPSPPVSADDLSVREMVLPGLRLYSQSTG